MHRSRALVLALLLPALAFAQTPVIGGACKIGSADVQIGGKQTQFFLKCEATSESSDGDGVWVVKSRAAASTPAATTQPLPTENTQPQQHPKITMRKHNPNICEQDNGAREGDSCAVSATCLQANLDQPTTFLQCEQSAMRWLKKGCQEGYVFNFEQQACIVPKRMHSLSLLSANSTNSTEKCGACPLGTFCANGSCQSMLTSNLCRDGSAPLGKCRHYDSGAATLCPLENECSAQGLCCPKSNAFCAEHRRCARRCPTGMVCSPLTSCCHNIMLAGARRSSPFLLDRSIMYDWEDMSGRKASDFVPDDVVEAQPTAPPLDLRPVTENTNTEPCGPKLSCTTTDDCPASFACDQETCRLSICPNGAPVKFRCHHQYHCKADEECMFGGCCNRGKAVTTTTTTIRPFSFVTRKIPPANAVAHSPTKISHEFRNGAPSVQPPRNFKLFYTSTPTTTVTILSQSGYDSEVGQSASQTSSLEPSRVNFPTPSEMNGYDSAVESATEGTFESERRVTIGGFCQEDPSFSGKCSLESPCSEESECMDGRCCVLTNHRCASTLLPLAFPETCFNQVQCPLGSTCEDNRCCPLAPTLSAAFDDKFTADQVDEHSIVGNALEEPEHEPQLYPKSTSTTIAPQAKCLIYPRCMATSMCPPRFTCSLEGKCCRYDTYCPDGTVPESLCSREILCPSAAHECTLVGTSLLACCVYSGQQANGLLCTYSACSNSNPCQTGSCNNGYCCSSGGSSSNAQIIRRWRRRVRRVEGSQEARREEPTVLLRMADWPIGPPGYGFPEQLSKLDSVLIKAQGDGSMCAGGFRSPIACGIGLEECPVGLHCDALLGVCCPLLLPLTDKRNPSKRAPLQTTTAPPRTMPPVLQPLSSIDKREHVYEVKVRPPSAFLVENERYPGESWTWTQANSAASPSTAGSGDTHGSFIGVNPYAGSTRGVIRVASEELDPTDPVYIVPVIMPASAMTSTNFVQPDFRVEPETGPIGRRSHHLSRKPQTNIASPQSSGCNGCQQQAPQIITIPVSQCPGGSPSYGTCSSGYCATGYSCIQGSCCPSNNQAQQSITVYTCPGGGSSVGQCVQGSCASGYQCSSQNTCCPSTNAYVCPDGTQAAGGCVNGLCGSGYSCSNGLCCASTSNQPKCLDGSPAVGACIPSCQGNGCGGTTLTYYCGTGYTCTTGNICCPVNSCPDGGEAIGPTVNGLCPTGYVAQGTQCCSIVNSCPDGAEYVGAAINGLCPTGTTLSGTSCCRTTVVFAQACPATVQPGPCATGQAEGDACSDNPGFACRLDAEGATATELACCPVVDYTESDGPCVPDPDTGAANSCPPDNTPVFVAGDCICVSLQTVPGLCDLTLQSGPCIGGTCPTGTCNVIADICCLSATMSMSRRRTTEPPRSIFSSRPRSALAGADSPCPNGDMPVSSCMNGLCGAGLQCVRDVCCPINPDRMVVNSHKIGSGVERPIKMCPSGDEARSTCFADGTCGEGLACVQGLCCIEAEPNYNTNMNMNRPSARFSSSGSLGIGSSCSSNRQCAGYEGGLSKCERRVCRCTSIAYAKGIACVRKKMLMFNDEPVPVESSADTNSVVAPPS